MGRKGRSGGKKKGKVHLRWPLKVHGKHLCNPYAIFCVGTTKVAYPGTSFATGVLSRIREKHTEILTWFRAHDFIHDAREFVPYLYVLDAGADFLNDPATKVVDEEAWLF